jgi:outer membrane receptor protein involved in Fe transport
MSNFRLAKTLIFLLVLVLGGQAVLAQTITGTLRGRVLDPNGGVVTGATILVKNQATGVASPAGSTNSDGYFVVPNLPPGLYTVTVEPTSGFSRTTLSEVDVRLGVDTEISVTLKIGNPTETVTITSSSEEVIQGSSQISSSFESRKVAELPSNSAGGGIDTIALLAPGVTPGFGNVNSNGVTLSVNGNRARSNNFTIDGTDNNDLSIGGPSFFVGNQEEVAEFQVVTNNYAAEFGRNQGAVVNIISKRGENEFHGAGFLYHRNSSALDSMTNIERRDRNRSRRDKFISNVYGGTIGGPIVRNRAFFFGSFQGIDQRQSFTSRSGNLAILPSEFSRLTAAYPGNAAIEAITKFNPFALTGLGTVRPRADGTFAAGDRICLPQAGATTSQCPTAANPTGTNVLLFNAAFPERLFSIPFDQNEFNVRGDVNVTQKDNFFVQFRYQDSVNKNGLGGSGGFTGDIPANTKKFNGGYTRQISNRIVNEFRANAQRLSVKFGGGCGDVLTGCIPDPVDIDKAFTNITFGGVLGVSSGLAMQGIGGATNLPQGRIVDVYQFTDNVTFIFSNHTLKAGVDLRKLKNSVPFLPNINGVFRFNSLAALTTNTPTQVTLADGTATIGYDEFDQFYFVQDDWKVRSNLTLNLGLRYEYTGQPVNILNDLSVARESGSGAFYRQNLPLAARVVPRLQADKNNIQPRFGFAYTPNFWKGLFGEGASVIRGGYSIAHDPAFYNILLNISTSAPLVFLDTIAAPIARPALPTNPTGDRVRAAASAALRRNTFDPRLLAQTQVSNDFYAPYSQQFSFGIQRQINNNNVAEIRYVGNRGIGLFQTVNRNPSYSALWNGFSLTNGADTFNFPAFRNLLPGAPAPQVCANDPATPDNEAACNGRLLAGRGLVRSRDNTGRSYYDSLQARYNGRMMNNNLTFGASYTWSKALDNASEIFSFGESAGAQNPFDINRGEKGLSGFDRRHAFSSNFIYDAPWFKQQKGFVGKLLGGFQLNGTYVLTGGRRYTPSQSSIFIFPATYQDATYAASFFGFDTFRPFSGNPNAPANTVAITDIDARLAGFVAAGTTSPTGFFSLNALRRNQGNVAVTPNDVRYIYNGPGAALRFGNPFGNVARNSAAGPILNQLNIGVFKTTRVRENLRVQFRAEFFNFLNTPNPGYGVAAGASLPDFFVDNAGRTFADEGEINLSSRRVQFGLRILF